MSTMLHVRPPLNVRRARARVAAGVVMLALMGLAGCAEPGGQGRYAAYEAGVAAHVEEGEVVGFRPVTITPDNTGNGAVIGGVGGAVVGSQFGGRNKDRVASGVVGAVAGALIGNAIEKGAQNQGYAYTVRVLRTRELIEIVQPDASPIPNGTHVAISYGARVRIAPLGGSAPRN
jgi:outer membrane lipoprotein SlyB